MRTIETRAVVTEDHTITLTLPEDIPPGECRVVLVIENAGRPVWVTTRGSARNFATPSVRSACSAAKNRLGSTASCRLALPLNVGALPAWDESRCCLRSASRLSRKSSWLR